jgi:hypothetical protein
MARAIRRIPLSPYFLGFRTLTATRRRASEELAGSSGAVVVAQFSDSFRTGA